MRNLVLPLPFLALAALPSPSVDACGYVTPAVFLVSTHNFRADGEHALVRIGGVVPERLAWQSADPMSYDGTLFSPAPALDAAMTVTLVGNDRRRVVSSARQRFVSRDTWWYDAPATAALDVGDVGDHYQLAIRGTHTDATFHPAEDIAGVQRISLSDGIVIDAVETAVDGELRVSLREQDRDVGTFPGRVLGGLDTDGGHYIVIENRGAVRAIIIWS